MSATVHVLRRRTVTADDLCPHARQRPFCADCKAQRYAPLVAALREWARDWLAEAESES